jgi:hypothetical protein
VTPTAARAEVAAAAKPEVAVNGAPAQAAVPPANVVPPVAPYVVNR